MHTSNVVTTNEQVDVFPLASVAVQVTVVMPIGNVDPLAGKHEAVTPGHLSAAVRGGYVTTTPVAPGVAAAAVMFAGQVIVGACVSTTVTVNIHELWLPEASVAVAVTVVVPFGNALPEGGLLTTTTPGQLSLAVTT